MADPAENIVDETDRGRSTRTPFLALTGVTIAVGIFVVIVVVLAFLAYYLS